MVGSNTNARRLGITRRSMNGYMLRGFGAVGDSCSTDADCGCTAGNGCCSMGWGGVGTCIAAGAPPVECPSGSTPDVTGKCCSITALNADGTCGTGTANISIDNTPSTTPAGGGSGGGSFWSSLFSPGNVQGAGQIANVVGNVTRSNPPLTTTPAGKPSGAYPAAQPPKGKPTSKATYAVVGVAVLVAGALILS